MEYKPEDDTCHAYYIRSFLTALPIIRGQKLDEQNLPNILRAGLWPEVEANWSMLACALQP